MARLELLEMLRSGGPRIVPSLLSCDFAHLADEVARLERAGAELLHLDVMDGHFVPNLTYGPVLVESLRKVTRLPLDAHLMIAEPQRYLDAFIQAGCDIVTFHVEVVADPRPLLRCLRTRQVVAGLSLRPSTPVERLWPWLEDCDLVLVMSVEPGFGGQAFQDVALDNLRKLGQLSGPRLVLEVDGGVNRETVAAAAVAGAKLLVAGTAVFRAADYAAEIAELSQRAQTAVAG